MLKKKKKHQDRKHAPLSPSAANRWLTCAGSYAASEGIETEASDAAKEGTLAHEWAERLRKACGTGDPNDYARELAILENDDEEMAYYVDGYIDFLDKLKDNFQSDEYDEYEEFLEVKVRHTDNNWGTLDYGCARRKKKSKWQAIISDFKYGRGVYVPAEDNEQLMNYLVCLEIEMGIQFEKAWLYIYQPRLENAKPYEIWKVTAKEISQWREKFKAGEKRCLDMKRGIIPLEFVAGDHCQFCPAQPQCTTFRAYTKAGDLQVLDDHDGLPAIERTPIEILVKLHKKKKLIEHYLENVDHFLLMRGLRKLDIGDLRIVEGRSNRRWHNDEEYVAKGLKKLGANPYRRKLITIGEAEKKIGKNQIDHLTTKPPGKLQLALPEDERPTAQLGKDSLALLD